MKICQDCQQFESRAKTWNYTHGATDPLPYIDDMIKPHKHIIFEERRVDGAGWTALIFRCRKCEQWWKLFAWAAVGQLDVKPYLPERRLSDLSPSIKKEQASLLV